MLKYLLLCPKKQQQKNHLKFHSFGRETKLETISFFFKNIGNYSQVPVKDNLSDVVIVQGVENSGNT